MTGAAFDPVRLESLGVPVRSLATDSRCVMVGDVFVACPGERSDGRRHIAEAIERGASAVLWEARGFHWDAGWQRPNLGIEDLRAQTGVIAAHVYGNASRELWMAGVTGTNGKTSCSHWIAQALGRCGRPTAVIGTLGNGFPGALESATHTTPDAVAVQAQLRRCRARGAQAVAMEVSSHALDQGRVNGTRFDTALFTNLTRDHLDYHGDMRRYGAAKAALFHWPGLVNAVINLDDAFGRELALGVDRARTRVIGYGIGHGDVAAHDVALSRDGLTVELRTPWGRARLASRLVGGFNVSNLLGTLGVVMTAGADLADAVTALGQVEPVAGRLEMIRLPGKPLVVVDYAHTPDALEKVLTTLRDLVTADGGGRLVCVFGCGGDRDPGKRPLMGEVATRLADLVIVTSDNPRSESPMAIIDQIVAGAAGAVRMEPERALAIAAAIDGAVAGDIVLIAGKGHEAWQEIAGAKLPFSDTAVAREVLAHV